MTIEELLNKYFDVNMDLVGDYCFRVASQCCDNSQDCRICAIKFLAGKVKDDD